MYRLSDSSDQPFFNLNLDNERLASVHIPRGFVVRLDHTPGVHRQRIA
jgi:hypothetical protein